MTTNSRIAGAILVLLLVLVAFNVQAQKPAGADRLAAVSEIDAGIDKHARQMLEDGRRVFRFDTFGNEAFWGETLQLHRALAGEKNGGVGGGVSPKTVLRDTETGSRSAASRPVAAIGAVNVGLER
jgi:hypothetical protein